ncbi:MULTISPECIES: hypothetical protein [Pseudomonas]|uniref:hypothetical protein n=1 Tax=Pseudomonas TaxID=286 RepID=UPI0013CE2A2E|nr:MULTISPECIES: hypothetical protein [Pseudomonas]MBI8450974.1 hypothetical protein [Pseudomonas aeruginosa]UJC23236.1 hypothetical protein HUK75_11025 [Pseudomonas aeruginosa]UJC25366.1 hypothetical protein HUK75_22310 [Pseudomonas aeruginosa]WBM45093.1 hypothetical protein M2J85_20550 [Pseudomonas putida]HCF1798798.1 hypothetical protein [Pseudomonas aeruginosa]
MLDKQLANTAAPPSTESKKLIELALDSSLNFQLHADSLIVVGLGLTIAAILIVRLIGTPRHFWRSFEINEAEFGLGDQKIKLSPNVTDQQIAYKIWVELSTRKIGIPIETNDDVISEIYDSWFNFFSVTRELIKDVPVQKFRRKDTEQIIRLSIEVLNNGIRPHLTQWQARFRRWYENQLKQDCNTDVHPQDIQKRFPQFSDLERDLLEVNQRLINYRKKMYEIIKGG